MTAITELGYMGIGVKSIEEWRQYAANIVGLEVVDAEAADSCYLRMDNWHHRVALSEDGTDDLAYVGLRVAGGEEFLQMQEQLEAADIKIRVGTQEEADQRHVLEVMKLEDPSGIPLEIFHGPHLQPDKPFHPGRRMHGRFKTGEGGLGHLLLRETVGLKETYEFYRLLGMRGGIEYRIPVPGQPKPFELLFMHCNSRDHTFAFGAPSKKRINHVMFEFEEFDDLGLVRQVVDRNEVRVGVEVGKHANDQMYSFYVITPSGFMNEFGWGGRPATHQSEYYQRDIYGHAPNAGVVNPDLGVVS